MQPGSLKWATNLKLFTMSPCMKECLQTPDLQASTAFLDNDWKYISKFVVESYYLNMRKYLQSNWLLYISQMHPPDK